MHQQTVRLNGRLFNDLWIKGGDKLVAVYCTLKAFKNGEIKYYSYTAKNNKSVKGLYLLRAKTNLTLKTIEKYVPILIDMGLCFIDVNGDFVMLGGRKCNELYNSEKIVPVNIGKNITETKYNCYKVKLKSEENNQLKQIRIKLNRRDQLKSSNRFKSMKAMKKAERIEKKYGKIIKITDKTVLSNQGYAALQTCEFNKNKSRGGYIKRNLLKRRIISSHRRFELGEQMSYDAYLNVRRFNFTPGMTYRKGCLSMELVADFKVVGNIEVIEPFVFKSSNKAKPLQHLAFDMIAWWDNN